MVHFRFGSYKNYFKCNPHLYEPCPDVNQFISLNLNPKFEG